MLLGCLMLGSVAGGISGGGSGDLINLDSGLPPRHSEEYRDYSPIDFSVYVMSSSAIAEHAKLSESRVIFVTLNEHRFIARALEIENSEPGVRLTYLGTKDDSRISHEIGKLFQELKLPRRHVFLHEYHIVAFGESSFDWKRILNESMGDPEGIGLDPDVSLYSLLMHLDDQAFFYSHQVLSNELPPGKKEKWLTYAVFVSAFVMASAKCWAASGGVLP